MVDLCTAALSRGHKVSVACTEHSVDGYGNYPEHIKSLNEQGIPLIFLNSTFSRDRGKNLQAVKTLEKEIVKNQPDIIHSHSSIPSYVAMNARSRQAKKTPIIQTMHGWGIYKTKEQETQDISIMEQVDHIVSISKSSEKLLIKKGLSNACRSIIFNGLAPNPVVENESSLNDEHILQIKRLKEKGIMIVGVVGTVGSRKNQLLVMDALSKLPDNLDVNAFFVGEGKDVESFQKRAKTLDISKRVTFTGYKADARSFISMFDLLISASLSEGAAPLVILEAFSNNTLVLASDTPENKEAIKESHNGFLFRSGDAQNLSEKIKLALRCENKKEILDSAFKAFESRFSLDRTVHNYFLLYNHLFDASH